jgi:hypothetical protein
MDTSSSQLCWMNSFMMMQLWCMMAYMAEPKVPLIIAGTKTIVSAMTHTP